MGGTSTGDAADSGDVTLTFLTFETPNLTAEFWDDAIARTNEVVPGVTIKKLVAPNADRDAYARQLDSTGALPDIMIAVSPTGLAEAGKLAEFSKDELSNWINPTSNSFDGKIFQLPTNTQTIPNIYYSKAAFAQAGIAEPPKTWDELLAAAEKLKLPALPPIRRQRWRRRHVGEHLLAHRPHRHRRLRQGSRLPEQARFGRHHLLRPELRCCCHQTEAPGRQRLHRPGDAVGHLR